MDYAFFEALTRRVEKATGEEKERLGKVRDQLLEMTQEMDKAARRSWRRLPTCCASLMEAPDLDEAIQQNLNRGSTTPSWPCCSRIWRRPKRPNARICPDAASSCINEAIGRLMQESAPPELQFIDELLQLHQRCRGQDWRSRNHPAR